LHDLNFLVYECLYKCNGEATIFNPAAKTFTVTRFLIPVNC
jgi:hypothetical protein